MGILRASVMLIILIASAFAVAQDQGSIAIPTVSIGLGGAGKGSDVSASLQILALLTILSLAPAILMLMTAFTRIVIILSFVRTALGTASVPPNQVVVGLSLFLTLFVMNPTLAKVYDSAIVPLVRKSNPIGMEEAINRGQAPVKAFMIRNTYEKDLQLFSSLGGRKVRDAKDIDLVVLVPAFVISEIKTAFVIGFYIFIPFLIIDLIVASVLMGLGMMMMPPTVVSLPAKLLVFIMADGWSVLIHSIVTGYA